MSARRPAPLPRPVETRPPPAVFELARALARVMASEQDRPTRPDSR